MKPEQLAALSAVKLRALVAEHLGQPVDDLPDPDRVGVLSTLVVDDHLWAYAHDAVRGVVGTAVGAGQRWATSRVNVIVDAPPASLTVAAGGFADPTVTLWIAEGRALRAADTAALEIPAPPDLDHNASLIDDLGLDRVADHGVWLAEINGIEVARVGHRMDDPDGPTGIEIGVGAYDQFASAALTQDRNDAEVLERVAAMVRPHRIAGAEPHPIGRLVRSRWLRAQVCRTPEQIGATELAPIPISVPRPGLVESQPAAALGHGDDGRVLAVFSVGVDLGVAEEIAVLGRHHGVDRAVLVSPARDLHPRIVDSLGAVMIPTSTVAVEGEWAG